MSFELVRCFWISSCSNGAFTLPDTDTNTDIKTNKLQQFSMALLCRCSVNTSIQFFTTHFCRCLYQSECRAVWTHHRFHRFKKCTMTLSGELGQTTNGKLQTHPRHLGQGWVQTTCHDWSDQLTTVSGVLYILILPRLYLLKLSAICNSFCT